MQTQPPELARLALELLAERGPAFSIETFCFAPQLKAISDPAKYKANCTSRRAGKTMGIAAKKLWKAVRYPRAAQLYLTLSRLNAKRIIWGELCELNRAYNLGGVPNESELALRFPNGHTIYCSGAKDKSEVEKFRGFPLVDVDIDEAQAFRAYLKDLVDDVLAKSLYDYDGELTLWGTPPPVPVGYFHDVCHNQEWSHHHWTMLENPHLKLKSGKDPMELILADCKRMGVTIDDPRIQRECFGRWVVDTNSLVFRWSDTNHYHTLPGGKFSHVLGVDLGYHDADAIAVLGWSNLGPEVYLVEESVKAKQGITQLVDQLERLIKKYQPLAVVMDTGGLGKKIAEEMVSRYGLPIKAAQKTEKFAHIEMVNDALRTRKLLAKRNSQFAQDSLLLEWDKDKSNGDRLVISDVFHSDICDAVLYAYREALGWLHRPDGPKAPKIGTPEWALAEAERMENAAEKHMRRLKASEEDMFHVDFGRDWT